MTNKNLTVLWGVAGSICFYYAANSWSMSQGGAVLLPGALLDDRPVPGSYLAIFVVSLLLAVVVRIGREYLVGKEKRHWSQRFPIVGLENLSPNDQLSRIYQGAFLLAFILVPMASLVHFNDKVLGHADVANRTTKDVFDNQPFYISNYSDVLTLLNYKNEFCMGQDLDTARLCAEREGYEGGLTWFPLVSPVAMLVVSSLSILYALLYLLSIWRTRE